MIQAIVFLPLIGAVLAGLISIFGAHARNPSGDTVEHHDDAHGHGTVPVNEDAGVIHASSHEPDGHDDHGHDDHAVEPPAAEDPVLRHPKIVITPHAAFNSVESLIDLRRIAAKQMAQILGGERPDFIVNPQVLEQSNLRAKLHK